MRQMTLTTLHGNRDRAKMDKIHLENQIRANVPEDKRTPGSDRCEVTAIFTDDAGSRLELHVTDWAEAAALKDQGRYTLTIEGID